MTRLVTLAAVLLVGAAAPAHAQPPGPPGPTAPTVVVNGEGEVRTAPDLAFVTLGAESHAPTPTDAQALAARAMTAVQQRLAAAGVPKDAIRTVTYDLQAQFD
ncbi:MAG TPA: SIMPL domain-containing protein, partial [Vicinamibacterales bacterium]|nr:SIMPL domain-containing protein [Vicinamibacterales bacterium]